MTTDGTFARRLVLDDIPMFDHHAILKAQDIDHDPVGRLAEAREPTVEHDKIAFCYRELIFVTQVGRSRGDQSKQSLATRWDMSTVLDIRGRPEVFGRNQILAIE